MWIEPKIYDGTLIHQRFAYKFCKSQEWMIPPYGFIACFRAPMKVEAEGMIDQEDVICEDWIYSDDALQFVWEIPNMTPTSAVYFQLLLNRAIADRLPVNTELKGDDIMRLSDNKKLSVSITKCTDGVALGHTGINIDAGKRAPSFAGSVKLSKAKWIASRVEEWFYTTLVSTNEATWKV